MMKMLERSIVVVVLGCFLVGSLHGRELVDGKLAESWDHAQEGHALSSGSRHLNQVMMGGVDGVNCKGWWMEMWRDGVVAGKWFVQYGRMGREVSCGLGCCDVWMNRLLGKVWCSCMASRGE